MRYYFPNYFGQAAYGQMWMIAVPTAPGRCRCLWCGRSLLHSRRVFPSTCIKMPCTACIEAAALKADAGWSCHLQASSASARSVKAGHTAWSAGLCARCCGTNQACVTCTGGSSTLQRARPSGCARRLRSPSGRTTSPATWWGVTNLCLSFMHGSSRRHALIATMAIQKADPDGKLSRMSCMVIRPCSMQTPMTVS